MKKRILWAVLGTMAVAITTHIITVIAVPIVVMDVAMSKYPANQFMRGPKITAQSRTFVKPCPDLVYSGATYDVSKGPIRLTVEVPTDSYWSLACFQINTDNFFVVNDKQVKSNPVEIILVKENMQCPDAGNAQVVFSPSDKGILLIRYFLISDEKYDDLVNIQNQASLRIGCNP